MHSVNSFEVWSRRVCILAGLLIASAAQAAGGSPEAIAVDRRIETRFDPVAGRTLLTGRAAPDLCFSLALPDEWRRTDDGARAAASDAALTVKLRSAQELRGLPHADLVSRDAAALQQDYEELLGRPAQSVSLSSSAGATRWSATWIDANLPTAPHPMTVETIIVPLSDEWVLELSPSGIETREAYNSLAQDVLARLTVQGRAGCRD